MDAVDCKVGGCPGGNRVIKGYCPKHYENFRITGDPLSKHEKKRVMAPATCSVGDCPRKVRAKGKCNRHYEHKRIYGRETSRRELSLRELVARTGWTVTDHGCWEWDGRRNENGYGIITAARFQLHKARAHRVVYGLFVRPLDDTEVLRHQCDNPPCVNPEHLEPGAQRDNVQDMVDRGHHWLHGRTTCKYGHDLTQPGATKMRHRNGAVSFECVACDRRRKREYEERKRHVPKQRATPKQPAR